MLTSVPRELSTITVGTPYSQPKNYLNYTFEKSHFHTDPVPFFESMGYKIVFMFSHSKIVSKARKRRMLNTTKTLALEFRL